MPCQTFTPLLEKVVKERGGRFKLLKVNADEEKEIAGAFRVSALPTMYVVWQTKAIADRIEGGISEQELNQLFDNVEATLGEQLTMKQHGAQQQDSGSSAVLLSEEERVAKMEEMAKSPEQKLEIAKQLISMGYMSKATSLLSRILTDDVASMDNVKKASIVPQVYSLLHVHPRRL